MTFGQPNEHNRYLLKKMSPYPSNELNVTYKVGDMIWHTTLPASYWKSKWKLVATYYPDVDKYVPDPITPTLKCRRVK